MRALIEFLQGLFPEVITWDPTMGLTALRTGNQDAIGIVIQPGPHAPLEYLRLFMTNPEEVANLWGHTALYVRVNGRIVRVIGFDPNRIAMVRDVLPTWLMGWGGRVSGGRRGTRGVYYREERMFRSPDMIAMEFPLALGQRYHLTEVLGRLPAIGSTSGVTHQGFLQEYVTMDGLRYGPLFDPMIAGNCINSIVQILTQSNLVIAPSGTRLSAGRLIARPDSDLTAFQTGLTSVALTGPNLQLHDLDLAQTTLANFHQPAMTGAMRAGRRLGTSVFTYGSARVIMRGVAATPVGTLVRTVGSWLGMESMMSVPTGAFWEYAAILKVLVSILVEGLPEDSIFWQLPLETLERILAGIVKCCFIYAVVVGDLDAWVTLLWLFTSLLMSVVR